VTKKLPTFKGYTVDIKLKQFRKIRGKSIVFTDFSSKEGDELLTEYVETLDEKKEEDLEKLVKIANSL
jgi:hypothetical protein